MKTQDKELNVCSNGRCVVEQVLRYRELKDLGYVGIPLNDAFAPIKEYYDEFKQQWYTSLKDYLDKATFISDFDFKLVRAVDSFDVVRAESLAHKHGWSLKGMFNRWFFAILINWARNVRGQEIRAKKRPAVQCPVCGLYVVKIDESHLQHARTTQQLPAVVVYEGRIYNRYLRPRFSAVCWGEYTEQKFRDLLAERVTAYTKTSVKWPWHVNGKRKVLCPLTDRLVDLINDDYISQLPLEYRHYADPMDWTEFAAAYPKTIIHSDIRSLDAETGEEDGMVLRDQVLATEDYASLDPELIGDCETVPHMRYQDVFDVIDRHVAAPVDKKILKMVCAGLSVEDISSTIDLPIRNVRTRMKVIRDKCPALRESLLLLQHN
jgi:hypothetical protein